MHGHFKGAPMTGRVALLWGLAAGAASADGHGIAMYGEPALPADYTHLPYANPDAPTGGRIVTGETGSFDSLNPFILKGTPPWQLRFLAVESLMGRSWDEPFTLYGLLAERVEVADDRSWVEFTLHPDARSRTAARSRRTTCCGPSRRWGRSAIPATSA